MTFQLFLIRIAEYSYLLSKATKTFTLHCFHLQYFQYPTGFFRYGVWKSLFRAKNKGIDGNMKGEGRILGRLLVVSEKKGIVFQYDEKEFGDHADLKDVLDAARKLAD